MEWSSYALSDFLLFSEVVYWRLFERANGAFWPVTLALWSVGGIAVVAACRGLRRGALAALAIGWLWAGWWFVWLHYAPINWAAPYLLPGFAMQALVLLALARGGETALNDRRRVGLGLGVYGLILHPLTALTERGMAGAEFFGTAPDATAFVTLGALVAMERGARLAAGAALPLLWCAISAITLHTLGAWQWIAPAAVCVIVAAAVAGSFREAE